MVLQVVALALLGFLSIVLDTVCVHHVVFYNKNIVGNHITVCL